MPPEALFQIANPLALAGWIILVLSPFAPRAADLLAGYVIPALLSAGYAALILAHFATAEGGYGSLPEVMRLFDFPGVALAGWVHYLAFDLFVGAWEVRSGRAGRMPHWLLLPCLALTFLFGPAGLLLFLALRTVRSPSLQIREA